MAEYIEREGLMHELGPYKENNFSQEMSTILQIVAGRPAADVAPVVHGQWVNRSEPDPDNNVTTTCSCCFHTDTHAVGMEVPFCWFCGAKMDKEE